MLGGQKESETGDTGSGNVHGSGYEWEGEEVAWKDRSRNESIRGGVEVADSRNNMTE